jgi:DNA modification methylase
MKETLEPTADIKMFFQPSETFDFSKHVYDLVMTSPPYFRIEEYEKMPEYGSKKGFLDKFFIPVVKKAWESLQKGGHLALNMPEEMYQAIRSHLPRLTRTYKLPLHNRNPSSAAKQTVLQNAPRSELIYVWRKDKRASPATRKQKRPINQTRKRRVTS